MANALTIGLILPDVLGTYGLLAMAMVAIIPILLSRTRALTLLEQGDEQVPGSHIRVTRRGRGLDGGRESRLSLGRGVELAHRPVLSRRSVERTGINTGVVHCRTPSTTTVGLSLFHSSQRSRHKDRGLM